MSDWLNRCHIGDVRDVLRRMIADGVKVNCIVTSPPYYGLRSYVPADHPDKKFEIGSEPTLGEFIATLTEVFDLAREVLADDGTCFVNMGDSYAGSWGAQGRQGEGGQVAGRSACAERQIAAAQRRKSNTGSLNRAEGLKNKDMMGQPWRLAFALQDAGWWLRQEIIWNKPNPMPESVRDRCTKAHEHIFLLTKSEKYYWNFDASQEPVSGGANPRRPGNGVGFGHGYDDVTKPRAVKTPAGWATGTDRAHDEVLGRYTEHRKLAEPGSGTKNNTSMDEALAVMPLVRNPRSVWTIPTQSYKGSHFATFPEALVERCLIPGCPPLVCKQCLSPAPKEPHANTELQDLPNPISLLPVGPGANEVLQQAMFVPGHAEGADSIGVYGVRCDVQAGPPEPDGQLLQQGMRGAQHGACSSHIQGLLHDDEGLRHGLRPESPRRDERGLRDATPVGDGEEVGAASPAFGGRSSQERVEIRQQSGESGADDQEGSRPAAEASDQTNCMPPLSGAHRPVWTCKKCKADLSKDGAVGPGVVLDIFFGSGTTGQVAQRMGMNWIGIDIDERNAELQADRIGGQQAFQLEQAA